MSSPLSLEEILMHPALPDVIELLPSTRRGTVPVAKNRSGGPIDIAYEIHGSGPTHLVWIMGLNTPRIAWHRQTRYFGHERGDKYTSLIFDNRGVGDSSKPYVRYSTSEMAKDVLELLGHVGWTNRKQLHVVGVSMGGMIAQELAILAPERIASLCLQSTAASLVSTIPWYQHLYRRFYLILPKSLPARLAAIEANVFSQTWLYRRDDLGVFPTNKDRYVAEELWRLEHLPPRVYSGFLLQALATSWHYVSPGRLKVIGERIGHVLVCTGDQDKLVECEHSEVLEKGIGGGVVRRVFEGAGHALQFECVGEYNRMVEEFVMKAEEGVGARSG